MNSETPRQKLVRENAERAERQAVFRREHQTQADAFVPTGWGIPGQAGKGPTQSSDTPGADDGDGGKA